MTSENMNERLNHLPVEEIVDLKGVIEVTDLEALAFSGEGEDIFTIAAIGKIGWLWGIHDNSQLIGAVELLRQKDPGKGFIHGVIIHPETQYKGAGTRLIRFTEEQALKNGMNQLECTIAPTNGASLCAFLNKCGYKGEKFIRDCYGPGGHRLWVSRNLEEPVKPFDYRDILKRQAEGQPVYFVEDNDYSALEELLSRKGMEVIGIVKQHESGQSINLLCIINADVIVR